MNRMIKSAVLAALLAGGVALANAEDVAVKLSGEQEVPAVQSAATGAGKITIAADKSVSGKIMTKGIEGTMAHIHQGAAPGKNGPPIITLEKGADGSWTVPAGSKLTDAQYDAFKAGDLYVNIHSAEHKGGEIRAALKP